jgi:hypothetical protein
MNEQGNAGAQAIAAAPAVLSQAEIDQRVCDLYDESPSPISASRPRPRPACSAAA